LPDPHVPPSPMNPKDPILDPVVALTYMAAQTSTIRLGTGIIILPQRNPLVLAKELASLDVLSGGRLIFGVGVGYLEPEFRALGIPFADRGPRTLDYIRAMQSIWGDGTREYSGRFVSYSGVQAHPQPTQRPHPPIVIGGRSPQAYRRAVALAHGWYGFGLNLEQTAEALAGLQEASERYARPPELGPLEISVTPRGRMDLTDAERFAALGVHRLILMPRGDLDASALEQFVTSIGNSLIGRV
ncbi:MAG: TIGR03619 family F420-dependent LLM class oxidoreductase, partial [Dehalococcoidia bacterium]